MPPLWGRFGITNALHVCSFHGARAPMLAHVRAPVSIMSSSAPGARVHVMKQGSSPAKKRISCIYICRAQLASQETAACNTRLFLSCGLPACSRCGLHTFPLKHPLREHASHDAHNMEVICAFHTNERLEFALSA